MVLLSILNLISYVKTNDLKFNKHTITSESEIASKIGCEILEKGGNSVDAAISTAIAIGIVNPYSSGIGGGGIMLIKSPKKDDLHMIDFREISPRKIKKAMYINNKKHLTSGALSICTPGEIKGFYFAHQKYGKLKWEDLFEGCIKLCNDGFKAHKNLIVKLNKNKDKILNNPGISKLFTKNGIFVNEGDLIKRKNLGKTLEAISKDPNTFYSGDIALKISKFIKENGGVMDIIDLKNYKSIERSVLKGKFKDYDVYTTNAPTSGAFLIEALNILNNFDFNKIKNMVDDKNITYLYHLLIEISKFIFARRGELGDPDFILKWKEIISDIIDQGNADKIFSKISSTHTLNKNNYSTGLGFSDDHGTTHLNVIDKERNLVLVTSSVNLEFGSMLMDQETGILFNNTMDDFSIKDVKSSFDLPFMPGNELGPSKRPFSSMAPIILENDKEMLAFGAAGGTKIPTSILNTIVYHLIGHNLACSISGQRIHNQLFPNKTLVEECFPIEMAEKLKRFGHEIEISKANTSFTSVQGILFDKKNEVIYGASDKRKNGATCGT